MNAILNSKTFTESTMSDNKHIDGQDLKLLVEAGLSWLKTNQQLVNALNVFPVPDGDTGTNMVLTLQAAFNEIAQSSEKNIGKMAKDFAQGALMGARGNSGVILSQLCRGFARAMDNFETMDADIFVNALAESRNTAYKGVVRPVEGTILTVAKDMSLAAVEARTKTDDLSIMLEQVVEAGEKSVENTPELLPILKSAGVVDSGGKGLFVIIEGMLRYIKGEPLDVALTTVQPISALALENAEHEIEEGQEVEVVIDFEPKGMLDIQRMYAELSDIGTSIQLGEGDGMYRMHIHTTVENQYRPIDYIGTLGTWSKIAMENLLIQLESSKSKKPELVLADVEPGQIAVVAVSPGKGISQIFASLGVAAIVEGGQTMNPSTEEILASFENLSTDKIVILPNNKNIVLAAKTSIPLSKKNVVVIPSTSIPQGLSAILRLDPDAELSEIEKEMNAALTEVKTGEVTIATRSVALNGVDVKEGQVIGLLNGKLVVSGDELGKTCLDLLEKASTKDNERITFFYGKDITRPDVDKIVDQVREAYPDHEIEVHDGGQPHYQFILSIE